MKLEKLLCLKYLGNKSLAKSGGFHTTKLLLLELQETMASEDGSSTISYVFVRKGGSAFVLHVASSMIGLNKTKITTPKLKRWSRASNESRNSYYELDNLQYNQVEATLSWSHKLVAISHFHQFTSMCLFPETHTQTTCSIVDADYNLIYLSFQVTRIQHSQISFFLLSTKRNFNEWLTKEKKNQIFSDIPETINPKTKYPELLMST